jgi:outer membrane protein OmpA-like peptidoglycan-associated protein
MIKLLLNSFFLICLFVEISNAQYLNFIPNSGAEMVDLTVKPSPSKSLNGCYFWYQPNLCTTDFYHTDMLRNPEWVNDFFGGEEFALRSMKPFKGNAIFGLYQYRFLTTEELNSNNMFFCNGELLAIKLKSKLMKGRNYHVGVYVKLSNEPYSNAYVSSFGFYFSKDSIYQNNIESINAIPQVINDTTNFISDTLSWQLIDGYFKATGGEEYLIMGNFETSKNTKVKIDYQKLEARFNKTKITYKDLLKNNHNLRAYWFLDETFLYEIKGDFYCYADSVDCVKERDKKIRDSINTVYSKFLSPINFDHIGLNESTALKSIAFEKNTSAIMFSSNNELQRLAAYLRSNPNLNIILNVYSNYSLKEKENKKLSLERGQNISNFLKMNSVNPKRIKIFGHSGLNYIVKNPVFDDKPKNYIVEIIFE